MNTQDSRGYNRVTENVAQMLRQRELVAGTSRSFQTAAHVTESMIKRLGLVGQLQGHKGCVNCLEWSEDGRLLISGSDDTKIILWDGLRRKQLDVVPTRHMGNIFSVKFLPRTNSSQVVTGAGDSQITVLDVGNIKRQHQVPLLQCMCHGGRVKRIATAPDLPDIFWSAGEDGLVLQFDIREKHSCGGRQVGRSHMTEEGGQATEGRTGSAVLIDLCRISGWNAEAKCVAINAAKPHLLAVGSNDPYVRLFDRRMMKTTTLRESQLATQAHQDGYVGLVEYPIPADCARYFAPGHLNTLPFGKEQDIMNYKLATTYVTFSPLGDELLVNLGGDHIYLYDINHLENYTTRLRKPLISNHGENELSFTTNPIANSKHCCTNLLPNFPTEEFSFTETPGKPNIIPAQQPQCFCDFVLRGEAFMKRKWLGDYYAAARDFLQAICMCDVQSAKARRPLVGIVYALVKLKWWTGASDWINILKMYHVKKSKEFIALENQIKEGKTNDSTTEQSSSEEHQIAEQEIEWRRKSSDYQMRYLGHCNTTTDIKEAAFIGATGKFIAAGSDDGALYIWRRDTGAIVSALFADTSIVNCVQPHPTSCLIATSGIETVVKMWQPTSETKKTKNHLIPNIWQAAETNQQRIAMNPFETMLANMGYQSNMLSPRFPQHPTLPVCQTS